MKTIASSTRCILVASSLLLGGCEQARGLSPSTGETDARYELQQDKEGRVVRLDKITGEVAIVKGEALIAVTPTGERARPVVETPRPVASTTATPSRPTQRSGLTRPASVANREAPIAAPSFSDVPESAPQATPQLPPGARVTIVRPSPVYLAPNENRTPLEILGKGSVGNVLKTEGDWYFIEFESPRWGRRVGFLKAIAVDDDLRALDLSVPDPTLQPLDLSVPDQLLEPLDLSVPDSK